jgi:alkaline phosphatase
MYLVTIAFQAYANDVVVTHQTESHWYQSPQHELAQKPRFRPNAKAKNVILFIGDGMGIGTVTAARILAGQNKGQSGEENRLSFEYFPFTGLSKTYNVDAQTPDSAGTMTAIITGVKTNAGLIGVDEHVKRGVCDGLAGHELVTTLEMAELQGKSTGIVTTARVTHATPAATYAKSADRDWEDISDLPKKGDRTGV